MSEHITSRRTLLGGALTATTMGSLFAASSAPAEGVSVPTSPTSSFFLGITTVTGDSVNAAHARSIDVLDWSFGVDTTISPVSTGGGASKSRPRDFSFVARTGVASPRLFLAAAMGTHFAAATLSARSGATDTPYDYLTIQMVDLYVTSYAAAPSPTDAVPLDVVHLKFGRMRMTFRPQNPSGAAGTPITTGFDFIRNQSY